MSTIINKNSKVFKLKDRVKGKVMVINKKTGEIFYADDPYELMKKTSKNVSEGTCFELITLDPEINFSFKNFSN